MQHDFFLPHLSVWIPKKKEQLGFAGYFLLILQRRPNTRISKTFSAFKLLAYETIHIGQKKNRTPQKIQICITFNI